MRAFRADLAIRKRRILGDVVEADNTYLGDSDKFAYVTVSRA
jgi:hypothetical protein